MNKKTMKDELKAYEILEKKNYIIYYKIDTMTFTIFKPSNAFYWQDEFVTEVKKEDFLKTAKKLKPTKPRKNPITSENKEN